MNHVSGAVAGSLQNAAVVRETQVGQALERLERANKMLEGAVKQLIVRCVPVTIPFGHPSRDGESGATPPKPVLVPLAEGITAQAAMVEHQVQILEQLAERIQV